MLGLLAGRRHERVADRGERRDPDLAQQHCGLTPVDRGTLVQQRCYQRRDRSRANIDQQVSRSLADVVGGGGKLTDEAAGFQRVVHLGIVSLLEDTTTPFHPLAG